MPDEPNFPLGPDGTAEDSLARVAMEWVVRRDRGLDPAESAALAVWLQAHPRHLGAFSRAFAVWQRLNGIGEVKSLAAEADALLARARANYLRRRKLRAAVAVVGLAAMLMFGLVQFRSFFWSHREPRGVAQNGGYEVMESTARRQSLPDGTIVELNGDSRIEVDYTPAERRVRLVAGEAHFFVAKDKLHPFLVSAHGVTVRAVGTAFNVRLAPTAVEVLVTEGKIRVNADPHSARDYVSSAGEPSDTALVAGQRAWVSTEAPRSSISVEKAAAAEIDQALAWQSTRLVFDHTPLDGVVEAFNRYNGHQLVIGSPELRNRTLTGVFRADNLDGFLRLLKASVDVIPERRSEHETLLLPSR